MDRKGMTRSSSSIKISSTDWSAMDRKGMTRSSSSIKISSTDWSAMDRKGMTRCCSVVLSRLAQQIGVQWTGKV